MGPAALGSVVADHSIRFRGHEPHQHDIPHLIYVVAGVADVTADDIQMSLRAHEAIWLQAHVPHAVRLSDGAMVLGPMLEPNVAPSRPIRLLGAVPAVVEIMTTILVAAPQTPEQILPFRRALGQVLRDLAEAYFPVDYPEHPTCRRLAEEALRRDASLEELARAYRLSARQVQRIFLSETGLPFSRWRSRAQLNGAIAYLISGGSLVGATSLAGLRTRAGLLKALERETGLPTAELARDPRSALQDGHRRRGSENRRR